MNWGTDWRFVKKQQKKKKDDSTNLLWTFWIVSEMAGLGRSCQGFVSCFIFSSETGTGESYLRTPCSAMTPVLAVNTDVLVRSTVRRRTNYVPSTLEGLYTPYALCAIE